MSETPLGEVDAFLDAADRAFEQLARRAPAERAALLCAVADLLEEHADELHTIAAAETHISPERLVGELARTTGQLRFLAQVAVEGSWLQASIELADPQNNVVRPDVRVANTALGVALIFAAGNFPFAFSVAGGDTAAALAAGCPVIVKSHPGHPELSGRTAALVQQVFGDAFWLIEGDGAARHAIVDARVRVAAFTGGLHGGRVLFDLATGRDDPIPFFGEFGSLNPVFVTPSAVAARAEAIADGFVASFTLGQGQLCTKPGLLFLPAGHGLSERIVAAASGVEPTPMLHQHAADEHARVLGRLMAVPGTGVLLHSPDQDPFRPGPTVLRTNVDHLEQHRDELLNECFGPTSIIVEYEDLSELAWAASLLQGSLTAAVHAEPDDVDALGPLLSVLQRVAGRVVFDGWPTGVRVGWSTHHGGPWPASASASHTSVGAASIFRFVRPVAFQNAPQAHLPPSLRNRNEWDIPRRIDGTLTGSDVDGEEPA